MPIYLLQYYLLFIILLWVYMDFCAGESFTSSSTAQRYYFIYTIMKLSLRVCLHATLANDRVGNLDRVNQKI